MASKDAGGAKPSTNRWKIRISLAVGAVVVLGACIAVRYAWGPNDAKASRPTHPTSPASNRTANAAPPAAPTTQRSSRQLKTVAVVNGEDITRQELAQESLRRFGKEVIAGLINRHLILGACTRRQITITRKDTDEEIERIAAKFGLSTDRWLMLLATERNINPEQYRREIIWPTLALRRLAADRLVVSEEELKQAWEAEYGPKVKVRMISVRDAQTAAQLRAKAAADPRSFGTLAKDYSEDQSAALLGQIPPIRRHMGDAKIEQTVFALKEGEVSPVVHAANQYLIFLCEQHIAATYIQPLHARVARTRLETRIRDRKLRTTAAEVFKKLQDDAKVVNVYNDPQLQRTMPGVAATINGRQITIRELSEECIVRHGVDVLEGEIHRRLLQQAHRKKNLAVTEQDIDAEIARAADAYGFLKKDGSPDVEAWLKKVTEEEDVTVDLYVRDVVWPSAALKKLVSQSVTVTNEDLRKGFQANYGERVEALAIVLTDQRRAQKVWEMARHNPTAEFFGQLAEQYSVEPVTRANRGRIPPIRRYGGQPVAEAEAFRLKVGELSGVIAAGNQGNKYIILRCMGRTKPIVNDISEVRDELIKDIREKKLRAAMAQEFDRLKVTATIDNYLAGTSQTGKTQTASPAPSARNASRSRGQAGM